MSKSQPTEPENVNLFENETVSQSRLTLSDPIGYSPPGSSVHGLLRARILEWRAIFFSGDLSNLGIEPRSPMLGPLYSFRGSVAQSAP